MVACLQHRKLQAQERVKDKTRKLTMDFLTFELTCRLQPSLSRNGLAPVTGPKAYWEGQKVLSVTFQTLLSLQLYLSWLSAGVSYANLHSLCMKTPGCSLVPARASLHYSQPSWLYDLWYLTAYASEILSLCVCPRHSLLGSPTIFHLQTFSLDRVSALVGAFSWGITLSNGARSL